jgi:hypothetical protein
VWSRTERFLLLFRIEHIALGVAHKFRGKFLLQFLGSSSNKKLPQYAPEDVSKSYGCSGWCSRTVLQPVLEFV